VPGMTETQRVWEEWFRAFSRIQAAWPAEVDVPCPQGDGGRVRVGYIGNPVSRIGVAYAWCDAERHGIYLTRVGIPPGAPMAAYDAPEEEQDAIVPPDLELLDPDPALPEAGGAEGQ
jgi:hypothetical protein